MLVVDPVSDPVAAKLSRENPDRITLVRNDAMPSGTGAMLRAMDTCCREPHALVVPLRADDQLLGRSALTRLRDLAMTGKHVVAAPTFGDGDLEMDVVAGRLDRMRPAPSRDGVSGLLADLWSEDAAWCQTPLIARGRPLVKLQPGPGCKPASACRPLPIGRLLADLGDRWVVFVRHAAKAPGSRFLDLRANRARGLSRAGRHEVAALGEALLHPPDVILTSPVVRARQTAEGVAQSVGASVDVVEAPELLCGRFHDHDRWLELKRVLGWEQLVRRWIAGEIPQSVTTPAVDALRQLVQKVFQVATERRSRRTFVVTQGYVNTGLFHLFHGRIDFSGGPLYGFQLQPEDLTKLLK